MANRDMNANRKPVIVFDKATVTTSVNSTTVNLQGFDACGFDVFVDGPVGDTLAAGTKTIEFDLQESSNGTTWNYVYDWECIVPYTQSSSAHGLMTTTPNTGGAANPGCFFMATANAQLATGTVLRVSYGGSLQYVRVVINTTGTTTGTSFLVVANLGYTQFLPVQGEQS